MPGGQVPGGRVPGGQVPGGQVPGGQLSGGQVPGGRVPGGADGNRRQPAVNPPSTRRQPAAKPPPNRRQTAVKPPSNAVKRRQTPSNAVKRRQTAQLHRPTSPQDHDFLKGFRRGGPKNPKFFPATPAETRPPAIFVYSSGGARAGSVNVFLFFQTLQIRPRTPPMPPNRVFGNGIFSCDISGFLIMRQNV